MKCSFCSAPLPKSGLLCNFCKKLNHLNQRIIDSLQSEKDSDYLCPICNKKLIKYNKKSLLYCNECDGIFCSEETLDKIIDEYIVMSVKKSSKLRFVLDNPRDNRKKVQYHSCPICKVMMQHVNYKCNSGIILDYCEEHGIWLDGGELYQISDWYAVGGNIRFACSY